MFTAVVLPVDHGRFFADDFKECVERRVALFFLYPAAYYIMVNFCLRRCARVFSQISIL